MRPDLVNRLFFVRCFPTRGRVTFSSAAAAASVQHDVWTRPAGAGHIRVAPRAAVGRPESIIDLRACVRRKSVVNEVRPSRDDDAA